MSALHDIIPNSPAAITAELIAQYQAATGKTLHPAQIEHLLIDLIAYRETLLRAAINDAARQNLVRFARAPMLDYLGELMGVTRLAGEGDERLRQRIQSSPEAYSVAGPVGAYRHHAMSAHASIVDVAVLSPEPGLVRLHPLTATGLPSPEILALVQAACSADDVRPLTDLVQVQAPLALPYAIAARLTLYRDQPSAAVMDSARAAAAAYAAQKQALLGRDIVPSQIVAALSVPGVYRVELDQPAAVLAVPPQGWAHCSAITLTLAGVSDG